jgi:DNA-binding transcriptional regulator YhcF (GntR family)
MGVTRRPANRQSMSALPAIGQPDVHGSVGLDVAIDRDAEVPIGVQLAWALRTRIGDGRFEPGQRLPGLRDLAQEIGVNVNTVRAVYQRLEQEGLIDSQQGSGTFVAPTPRRASAVGTIAANAAREAHETGVDPREVAAALYITPESPGAQPDDEGAERSRIGGAQSGGLDRRRLRTQIAALERTLGEIEAEHPGVAPVPTSPRTGNGPALLNAEELEQVRTQLVRRLSTVQAAIDAHTSETAEVSQPQTSPARKRRTAKPDAATSTPAPKRTPRPRTTARPAPAST